MHILGNLNYICRPVNVVGAQIGGTKLDVFICNFGRGSMKLFSYAKINLGLKVLGKREDGYHDILSLFHEIDLADTLTVRALETDDLRVTSLGAGIPDGPDNLAYRAADALRIATNRPELGAEIDILKQIPAGGGLGGGSSNAGSTLVALNKLWDLNLAADRLATLGASIGSDVPFFIRGGTALVTGRGEHLQRIDSEGDPVLVLVEPGFGVSTPWAFGKVNIELTSDSPYIRFLNSVCDCGKVDLLDLLAAVENDFLTVVAARYPSIQHILSVLREGGAAGASMSGTGATLYGGFAQESDAQMTIDRLRNRGYTVRLCRPVRRLSTRFTQ